MSDTRIARIFSFMDRAFLSTAPRVQWLEIEMSKYEVSNVKSSHSFGVYEAESAEAAIEACCRDAGYDSKAQAEEVMGHESELIATEVV